MKKILLPFLLAFIFSCSSDSDSSDSSANIYEQDLAGSWTANFCEPDDATSCTNQNLVLALDGTGSVSNSWTSGEEWSSDLEWSATASSFTLTTLIDDETSTGTYELNNSGSSFTLTIEGMSIVYNRM